MTKHDEHNKKLQDIEAQCTAFNIVYEEKYRSHIVSWCDDEKGENYESGIPDELANIIRDLPHLINSSRKLKDALADALTKNAMTLGHEAAKMIVAMAGASAGNENSVQVTLGGARCPYCGHVSATIEDATEHDGICPKHPAVMRAMKAEADKAALVGEVKIMCRNALELGYCNERFCQNCNMTAALIRSFKKV